MDEGAWAAGGHEGDVDDGRVVVARVLAGAENGGQRQKAAVGHLRAARVAAVHYPVQQLADVRVELEQQHHRLLSQRVDLRTEPTETRRVTTEPRAGQTKGRILFF